MKRLITTVVASAMALSLLAGCGATPTSTTTPASQPAAQNGPATPTLDKIKKDGKLSIGTSPDYPPYESLDKQNNVIGFDVDLMQAVADKLGVKLDIVQTSFDSLIPALQAKKFDVMAAGVTVTDKRKEVVDFSTPYIVGSDSIVINKNNAFPVTKLEDLKGKKVATQIGTVQADALHKVDGITVKEYNLFTEVSSALSAKQVDAMYLATHVANQFMKNDPNLQIALTTQSKDTAYALRKDTPDLTKLVSQVIDEMKANGKMDQLVAKWFK